MLFLPTTRKAARAASSIRCEINIQPACDVLREHYPRRPPPMAQMVMTRPQDWAPAARAILWPGRA